MKPSKFGVLVSLCYLAGSGSVALLAPGVWARLFGLQTNDARAIAFIRAAGIRELVLAAVGFSLLSRGDASLLVGLSTFIGVVDFAVTLRTRGMDALGNLIVHSTGIVQMSSTWLRSRRSDAFQ